MKMLNSGIEWCDASLSPWFGCQYAGIDCHGCYAEELIDKRFGKAKWGNHPRIRAAQSTRNSIYKYNRKALQSGNRVIVFVGHLCDFFDDSSHLPEHWRTEFWKKISDCNWLQILIPTKRPWKAVEFLSKRPVLHHVMIGISAGYQGAVDKRLRWITPLQKTGYRVFVSAEPLLETVDYSFDLHCPDWLIVGGHSAKNKKLAKPCAVEAIADVALQARVHDIPLFVKQLGSNPIINGQAYPIQSKKGGEPCDWPAHLRIREYPNFEPLPTLYRLRGSKRVGEQLRLI